jgi:hypothetical protein
VVVPLSGRGLEYSLGIISELSIIERSVEKAHVWINDLAAELGSDDQQAAYRVLRAFLGSPSGG